MKKLTGHRWWSILLMIVSAIVAFKLLGSLPALWRIFVNFLGILSPFIGGAVLAFLLYRPCCAVEGLFAKSRLWIFRRPARAWAISIVYLILLGVLALTVWGVFPLVVEGITGLIKSLPLYYERVVSFIQAHRDNEIFTVVDLQATVDSLFAFLQKRLTVENLLGYVSGIVSITSSAVSVLLSFIISIYMLAGRESLFSGLRRMATAFLPSGAERLLSRYLHKTYDIFSRYMYSMLLDALCISIMLIPGMYISGISYPIAFAVLVGVANLIPYFGAIVSGALCVLVLVLSGNWGMALFLGAYILVAQQLDSNLLQPRLFSQSVGIEPLYVLLAITVGGGIGGFVGMLIGVPVTAVIKILLTDLIDYCNRKKSETLASVQTEEESL